MHAQSTAVPHPLAGHRGQQPGLVPEVVLRRGVRDPCPTGQIPQAHGTRTGLADHLDRRVQERPAQVTVVIGLTVRM